MIEFQRWILSYFDLESGYILINATLIKDFVCKFLNICIRNENLTISTIERVSSINDQISNQSEEEKGLIEVSNSI